MDLAFWKEWTSSRFFPFCICSGWHGWWIWFSRSSRLRTSFHLVPWSCLPIDSVRSGRKWIMRHFVPILSQPQRRPIRCLFSGVVYLQLLQPCIMEEYWQNRCCFWSRLLFMYVILSVYLSGVLSVWWWRPDAAQPAEYSTGITLWCFHPCFLWVDSLAYLWHWQHSWPGLCGRCASWCIRNGSGTNPTSLWNVQSVPISSALSIVRSFENKLLVVL